MIHFRPSYVWYDGGFASVTKCKDCECVGLYEDMHPADPCPECGGRLKETVGAWNPPIKKWNWFKFRMETIQEGYWKGRDGNKL